MGEKTLEKEVVARLTYLGGIGVLHCREGEREGERQRESFVGF